MSAWNDLVAKVFAINDEFEILFMQFTSQIPSCIITWTWIFNEFYTQCKKWALSKKLLNSVNVDIVSVKLTSNKDEEAIEPNFFYLVTFSPNVGSAKIGVKDEEELEKEAAEADSGGICRSYLNPWDRLCLWQVIVHNSFCKFHGHINIRELTLLDRTLWFLVVLAFLALASVLTWDTWTQWQKNQVKDMLMVFIHHLHLGCDHSKGHGQANHRLALSRHHHLCLWTTHG